MPVPEELQDARPGVKVLYRVLADTDEDLSPTQLATKAPLSQSTVTRSLRDLEEAGVVTSHPDPDDSRRYLYSLRERQNRSN